MQRRKICRYFQKGSCKKQDCPFVHLKQNRKNCKFFMEGFCRRGDQCNFYHPPPQQDKVLPKSSNTNNKKKVQYLEPEHFEKQQKHEEQYQAESSQEEQTRPILDENDKITKQKLQKINFLLGVSQSESQQQERQQQHLQNKQQQQFQQLKELQFTKIYPKQFPDNSKKIQTKEFIKQNQEKYFKQGFMKAVQTAENPSQKQHLQIIRKFQDSFRETEQHPLIYTLNMRPLLYDKDFYTHFPLTQETINLKIDERTYPKQKAKFSLLNQSFPIQYKNKIQQYLSKFHQKANLFETLKHFQNNFQKVYYQTKFKLENQHFSQKDLKQKLMKEQIKILQAKQEIVKTQKSKKKRQKVQRPVGYDQVQVLPVNQAQQFQISSVSYEVTVQSTNFKNCQYIIINSMLIYLDCYCEAQIMHILDFSNKNELKLGVRLRCKKCNTVISIFIAREIIQHRAHNLAKIGVDNARLIEIGGISWKVGCNCDSEIAMKRLSLPGARTNINCHSCFAEMMIEYMGLKFFNPHLKQFQMQIDKPLYNKGACKHFKLSFRWVRYACCGRCFSCDQCHINYSIRPHQKIPGLTMICGFCAYEQFVNDSCINCKEILVKGVAKSGHWQGGLGCRDQANMSRKDNKKYAGLTKKK